ncbi:hypothetical protein IE81DRAFT_325824 [Ceraceosorus guamensis]|uniref:Uncharacterized protein n=1 Tax=Ceraceosorus guamensis TaxID=1522189 RepID=A0A316VV40_9BASI|nr:hypothetical protein IE81DRAFT_325824 [Ceraceosorus guamensis]PWN40161.1 hypothetical protein IE81DRAFT_325824 [Ceraceosorus guamensis]
MSHSHSAASLAKAIRRALSGSSSSGAIPITDVYAALSDDEASGHIFAELVLLSAPPRWSAIAVDGDAAAAAAGHATLGVTLNLATGQLTSLQSEWHNADLALPDAVGTMRRWPIGARAQAEAAAAPSPSPSSNADLLHLVHFWWGASLYIPAAAAAVAPAALPAASSSYPQLELAGLEKAFAAVDLPRALCIAFALRLRTLRASSSHAAAILSSTALAPLAIQSRAWDASEPSLPADLASPFSLRPTVAASQPHRAASTRRALPLFRSRKISAPAKYVIKDAAASEPTTTTTTTPSASSSSSPTEVTSTSTSNSGSAVATAIGPKSAAAATSSNSPNSGKPQDGGASGGDASPSTTPSERTRTAIHIFSLGSLRLNLFGWVNKERLGGSPPPHKDASSCSSSPANAVCGGAVVVAVPGSSASASYSAAAGQQTSTEAEAEQGTKGQGDAADDDDDNEAGGGQGGAPASGTPTPSAARFKRFSSQGQIQQTFVDADASPKLDAVAEESDGGMVTRTTVTTVTTTDVHRMTAHEARKSGANAAPSIAAEPTQPSVVASAA